MLRSQLIQVKSGLSCEYKVALDQQDIYNADVPRNMSNHSIRLFRNKNLMYTLERDCKREVQHLLVGEQKRVKHPYIIRGPMGDVCGAIYVKRTKTFMGYYFFEIVFRNVVYQAYEIGCGKEGIKMPVYCGMRQVALVQKNSVTHDNLDNYQICAESENTLLITVLLNLFYDCLRFGNYGEASKDSRKTYYLYTSNKELRAKYDPLWGND